jgi:hypothetical protein
VAIARDGVRDPFHLHPLIRDGDAQGSILAISGSGPLLRAELQEQLVQQCRSWAFRGID